MSFSLQPISLPTQCLLRGNNNGGGTVDMHLTMDYGEAQATWRVDRFVDGCKEKITGFFMLLGAYVGPNSYPALSSF